LPNALIFVKRQIICTIQEANNETHSFLQHSKKNGIQILPSMLREQLIGHVYPFHIGIPNSWWGHKARTSIVEWYTSNIIDEIPQSHFDGNFNVRSNKKKKKKNIKNECGHNLMNVIDKLLDLQHHHE
jgi:hypothetical protein